MRDENNPKIPVRRAHSPESNGSDVPRWDEATYTLWYQEKRVKKLERRATAEAPLCRAFEAQGWPRRILDPLPCVDGVVQKQRLHDAIKLLNRGQRLIHFGGDGTGGGVTWDPYGEWTKRQKKRPRP